MSYQVLARRWRPKNFSEVAVQIPTIKVLQHSLDNQKIHHAYLFTGTRGVGKTTIARILAKSLVCEKGISSTPCNECSLCISVNNGNCVDVIEIDAASRTKVEDTRLILDNLAYAPSIARFKIYIIDEVHMLSMHSFNALLKSLEEPPSHVKFLLATTDPQKLPITVLSRCLHFKLKVFSNSAILEQLKKILLVENSSFEQDAMLPIAMAANGSMRDALSLLEQVLAFCGQQDQMTKQDVQLALGLPDSLQLINLLSAIFRGEITDILAIVNTLVEVNCDFFIVLQEMQTILKNIAILQLVPQALSDRMVLYRDLLLNLATVASKEEIQLYYEIVVNGFRNLPFTPDPKVGFEMIMLRMVAFVPVKDAAIEVKDIVVDNVASNDTGNININTINVGNIDNYVDSKNIKYNKIKDKDKDKDKVKFFDVITQCGFSGLTKELAEIAAFEFINANSIKLIIDENKKMLVTKNNLDTLQTAFSRYFGRNLSLKVEFQDFQKHPNLLSTTVRAKKQLELQDFIKQEENLQQLIVDFDGKVI